MIFFHIIFFQPAQWSTFLQRNKSDFCKGLRQKFEALFFLTPTNIMVGVTKKILEVKENKQLSFYCHSRNMLYLVTIVVKH